MPVAWPPFLPQNPLVDGFQETFPVLSIRTNMDAGPAKTRRRFSSGVTKWSAQFRMSNDQRVAFVAFWKDDLEGGSQPFIYIHPITLDPMTCRIVGEPTFSPTSRGLFWTASVTIEILP